jgi:hypothetical protein
MMCTIPTLPDDALVVSFDTEWETQRLTGRVVEIGVTTLKNWDTTDNATGQFGRD